VRIGTANLIEMSISENSGVKPCSAVIEYWDGPIEQERLREETFNDAHAEDELADEETTKRWGFVGWRL